MCHNKCVCVFIDICIYISWYNCICPPPPKELAMCSRLPKGSNTLRRNHTRSTYFSSWSGHVTPSVKCTNLIASQQQCTFQAQSVGFPQRKDRWRSAGSQLKRSGLDLLLQCSHWEGLDDGLSWLRLHLGLLAKHHPDSGFCGWLQASLDAAHTWNGEHTCLLHLTRSKGHEAVDHLGASLLLQAVLSSEGLGQCTSIDR